GFVKRLIADGWPRSALGVTVVLDGAVAATPDESPRPHNAGLIGLARTARAEYPRWRVGCVDIGTDVGQEPVDLDRIAGLIAAEDLREPLVALRGGHRLVRRFEPAAIPLAPA